jgi:hypothetical protein
LKKNKKKNEKKEKKRDNAASIGPVTSLDEMQRGLVSALSSLLFFIERRLCIDGVDWLFLFVSWFLIGSFSCNLIG